jgi:hypothetical protein
MLHSQVETDLLRALDKLAVLSPKRSNLEWIFASVSYDRIVTPLQQYIVVDMHYISRNRAITA